MTAGYIKKAGDRLMGLCGQASPRRAVRQRPPGVGWRRLAGDHRSRL